MAGTKKTHVRNKELARGINALSRSSHARKTLRYKFAKKAAPKAAKQPVEKTSKSPRFYPADDIPKPLRSAKTVRNSRKTAVLRKNITPGTVLILLSGRFRGKRVVFLKQLASGTLLVTGPYKVNGVPLRRVNQAFVIATSTKVDISGVTIPESVDDSYFARDASSSKKGEEEFFAQSAKGPVVSEQRKKDQKAVDSALLKVISKEPLLSAYLAAKFTLTKGQKPHELKF